MNPEIFVVLRTKWKIMPERTLSDMYTSSTDDVSLITATFMRKLVCYLWLAKNILSVCGGKNIKKKKSGLPLFYSTVSTYCLIGRYLVINYK